MIEIKQIDLSIENMFIFGEFSMFLFSFLVFVYLMSAGGFVKGIYSSCLTNLLFIIVTIYLNSKFNLNQNIYLLVLFELILILTTILTIHKSS